jgi:hypothetical protein
MCKGQLDGICAYAQNMPKDTCLDFDDAIKKMNDLVNHGCKGMSDMNERKRCSMANLEMQDVEACLCILATMLVKDNSRSTSRLKTCVAKAFVCPQTNGDSCNNWFYPS